MRLDDEVVGKRDGDEFGDERGGGETGQRKQLVLQGEWNDELAGVGGERKAATELDGVRLEDKRGRDVRHLHAKRPEVGPRRWPQTHNRKLVAVLGPRTFVNKTHKPAISD